MKNLRASESSLDSIDVRLVEALIENGRLPISDLARLVGMSAPSVAERIRNMEADGIIRGFSVDIDPKALGYRLQAIVRIKPLPGQLHIVQRLIDEIPEFTECHKVTGDDCFVARLYLRSIDELDGLLDKLIERAETNTSIIKSSPVERRLPPLKG